MLCDINEAVETVCKDITAAAGTATAVVADVTVQAHVDRVVGEADT